MIEISPHPDPLPTASASPTLGEGASFRESAQYNCYINSGYLINSAQFDGLDNSTAKTKITEYLETL